MTRRYELRYLSNDFYIDYPPSIFVELEQKINRPFLTLLIKIDGLQFAIPFRTNIKHNYCYKFRNTTRKTSTSTGIDFSKAIVVTKSSYLLNNATIDNEEFIELNKKYFFIINKFKKYVNDYKKIVTTFPKDSFEYEKMKYSTLQYFHKELRIE